VKVAVVAAQHREALEVIARLGMVGKAEPFAAEITPVSGHRFTAVLVVAMPKRGIKDRDWWMDLLGRNSGPVWTLDEWGKP
jgi:hypothetical protein